MFMCSFCLGAEKIGFFGSEAVVGGSIYTFLLFLKISNFVRNLELILGVPVFD